MVLITAPDRAAAETLATSLIGERLAACANLVPGLVSHYWWGTKLDRADEVLILIKTRADRVPELIARAAELHPYDVPEVLAFEVEVGFEPYVNWVRDETCPRPRG